MSGPCFDSPALGGQDSFDALTTAVCEAGDKARRMFERGDAHVTEKDDRSPVTAADLACEEHLRRRILALFPDATFVGEETGVHPRGGPLRFLVDPIDGTRAFMRGLPTWSVLCAVEVEGELEAAWAYLPAAGELYRGQRGRGAWLGESRLRVSEVKQLSRSLVCHGGLNQFRDDDLLSLLPVLAERTFTQRGLGDFAGYAALLKGQVDAVVDPAVQPHDVAPAALLVEEAGGRFTDLNGQPTVYGRGGLASNGHLHDVLLTLIARQRIDAD